MAVAGARVEVREAARSWDSNLSCPSPARSLILQGTGRKGICTLSCAAQITRWHSVTHAQQHKAASHVET